MKKKTANKLILSKKVIANLNTGEANNIKGGTYANSACNTFGAHGEPTCANVCNSNTVPPSSGCNLTVYSKYIVCLEP